MNPYENYTTASVAQQNWERRNRRPRQRSPEQRARNNLREKLISLQQVYPESNYKSLYRRLYQFAWIEEYDELFDDLDLVVDELVSQEVNDG